ncbi:MAG: XdhC/CoxI family protein [Clostridia bacterium]
MSNLDILNEQLKAQSTNMDYATITIVKTGGSTPRSSGKMLVYADGTAVGTIGGGALERASTRDAMECISSGANAYREYDLAAENKNLGMICGGSVSVLIEVFTHKPQLVMCGAGHVGGALIRLAQFLGFFVTLVDNRDEALIADKVALADRFVKVDDFESAIAQLDTVPGSYFVIATFAHAHDGTALYAALQKHAAYIGMIGSHIKIDTLFKALASRGISPQELESVYTPIGLDIGGETPEEIALAIMAEIMKLKNSATGKHLRDIKKEG